MKELGLSQSPTQNLSYTWQQFSHETKNILDAAARGIAQEAIDHGVVMESRVLIVADEDDPTDEENEQPVSREYAREQGNKYKLVDLARRHGYTEFTSDRADNRIYQDEEILDPFTTACLTKGSAYSEGEAAWFLDENGVCDDPTFLHVIKQFAMPADQKLPKPLQEYRIEGVVAVTEVFRAVLLNVFDTATANILKKIC